MNSRKSLRRVVALLSAVVFAVILAGCGAASDNANSDHNAQDIRFATGMIPHHAQAVDMAKMAEKQASNPAVKALASQIEAAQQPEIDTMNSWLKSWGETESHSMHGSDGMMSTAEMTAMKKASGPAFDKMFLEAMIKHHEGAISMAKTEQQKGRFEAAKTMANSVVTSQQAEVDQMKKLL
jgi:uncharacterized protein (DUF305 family)